MLEDELTKLAASIHGALMKYRVEKPPVTVHQIRVRRPDFSLKYRADGAFVNFEPSRIEEDIWDWRDQERFHDIVVNALPDYQSLVSALGPQAHMIQDFARFVSFASFRGNDKSELSERVIALGRELEDRPLPVKVTAFIDGLTINEFPLRISDAFVLRKPTTEDVAQYIRLDEYGGFSHPLADTWFSVVGELVFDAISTGIAQGEFLRTIETLRLFRVGGVAANRYEMRSRHSFLHGGVMTSSAPSRFSQFSYELLGADAFRLSRFLQDIAPLIPDPFHASTVVTERNIAYMRYNEALFQERPSERPITSAITALEALFLEGETELTHRLAQRVSLFLRALGTHSNAQETYDNVKKGYKIRSTFIHGASLKIKDRPEADSLAPILLEYSRECVLAFLQISTPKADILRILDRAMLDITSLNDLESYLKQVKHF
jgi:hypothetical protein